MNIKKFFRRIKQKHLRLLAAPSQPPSIYQKPSPTNKTHSAPDTFLSLSNRHINSDQPKVLLVSHGVQPHGAQYLLLHIAKFLTEKLDCQIELITLSGGSLLDEFRLYTNVHVIDETNTDSSAVRELLSRLHDSGFQFAITNTAVCGLFAGLLKDMNFNVVSLIHELPAIIKDLKLEQHCATLAEKSDVVIFPTSYVRDKFMPFAKLSPEKVLIKPQGLFRKNRYQTIGEKSAAAAELRDKFELPSSCNVVLGVGYADARKGIDLFVESGIKVLQNPDDTPNTWFIWVGHLSPLADDLRQKLETSEFKDHFIFPGLDFDTDTYYAGADVYALTSREDPFPSVVLEALNAATPVVAFDGAGGFVELLRKGCGLLATPFESDDYSEKLSSLLNNPTTKTELGLAGQKIIAEEYSFPDYVRELLNLRIL